MLCVCVLSCFSRIQLFVTLWAIAHQLLCPWGFSRQEYWSGLSSPSPWDLLHPGIEPESSAERPPPRPPLPRGGPLCCILQDSIMLLVNYISMKWEGGKEGGWKEGRRSRVACWGRGAGELGAAGLGIQWTLRGLVAVWHWAGQGGGALQERAGRCWHRARRLPSNNSLRTE